MGEGEPLNHEPPGYACPFCFLLGGGETELDSPHDIVARSGRATALIASVWWPNNPGHVIVVPDAHHENLYDLPAADGHAVHDMVRTVARAMRLGYGCSGVSVRQHNEPDGGQEIWHHHVHVIPRYADDELNGSRPSGRVAPGPERWAYARTLRNTLAEAR